jgi:hypothetical protein
MNYAMANENKTAARKARPRYCWPRRKHPRPYPPAYDLGAMDILAAWYTIIVGAGDMARVSTRDGVTGGPNDAQNVNNNQLHSNHRHDSPG